MVNTLLISMLNKLNNKRGYLANLQGLDSFDERELSKDLSQRDLKIKPMSQVEFCIFSNVNYDTAAYH